MTSQGDQSPDNGNISNGIVSSDRSRSGISHQVAKRALLICWALAVFHIWLASDGIDGPHMDDNDVDERMRYEGYYSPIVHREAVTHVEGHMNKLNVAVDDGIIHTIEGRRDNSTNDQHTVQDNAVIPEALQHITYKGCCVPAIYKDYAKPNDIKCFGTCYSERACNDPMYPYSSMEERHKFGNFKVIDGKERRTYRERCIYKPPYLMPNVTWWSQTTEIQDVIAPRETDSESPKNSSDQKSSSIYGNIPEPGCSLVTSGGGSGPWQHLFVFPSAKLAFCGIPKGMSMKKLTLFSFVCNKQLPSKRFILIFDPLLRNMFNLSVGITQWIQFARFVAGAKDYPSLPHYKLDADFFRFDKLDPSIQQEIWQDEKAWTWAVFLREPAERLLSAYLDKVLKKSVQVKEALGLNSTNNGFTFRDFINRLAMEFNQTGCKKKKLDNTPDILSGMSGLNWCSDPRGYSLHFEFLLLSRSHFIIFLHLMIRLATSNFIMWSICAS